MSRIDDWREILVAAAALETGMSERLAGEALVPGGRLAIQEVVAGLAAPPALFAVAMLIGTQAGEVHGRDAGARGIDAAVCPLESVIATTPERNHLLVGGLR